MHRYCAGLGGAESLHHCGSGTDRRVSAITSHLLGKDARGPDRVAAQSLGQFVSSRVGWWTLHLIAIVIVVHVEGPL